MDSLNLVHFFVELVDEYGIVFTENEIDSQDFQKVGTLIALIEKKIDNRIQ